MFIRQPFYNPYGLLSIPKTRVFLNLLNGKKDKTNEIPDEMVKKLKELVEKIKKNPEKYNGMTDKLKADYEEQIKKCNDEKKEIEKDNEGKQLSIDKLTQKHMNQQNIINEIKKKNMKQESAIAEAYDYIKRYDNTLKDQDKKNNDCEKIKKNIMNENINLTKTNADLGIKVTTLNENNKKCNTENNKLVEEIDKQTKECNESNHKLNNENLELKNNINILNEQNNILSQIEKEANENYNNYVNKTTKEKNTYEQNLDSLNKILTQKNKEHAESVKENKRLIEQLTKLQVLVGNNSNNITMEKKYLKYKAKYFALKENIKN